MIKTEQDFIVATGRQPEDDDMDRVNCDKAGGAGHHQCGWCDEHNKPRFMCDCLLWKNN